MLKILPRAIKMFDRGERRKSLETKFTSVYAESSPNPHECKIGNILVWVVSSTFYMSQWLVYGCVW